METRFHITLDEEMINRYCVITYQIDTNLIFGIEYSVQMNNCIYTHWILFSPKINYEAKQSKQAHVHVDNINRKSGFTYTSL